MLTKVGLSLIFLYRTTATRSAVSSRFSFLLHFRRVGMRMDVMTPSLLIDWLAPNYSKVFPKSMQTFGENINFFLSLLLRCICMYDVSSTDKRWFSLFRVSDFRFYTQNFLISLRKIERLKRKIWSKKIDIDDKW